MSILQTPEDDYPDHPEDWIDVTEEDRQDYSLHRHAANIPSRMIHALDENMERAMATAPKVVRHADLVIKDIGKELHQHVHTLHGNNDLLLAQNRDVHVLIINKLVAQKSTNRVIS